MSETPKVFRSLSSWRPQIFIGDLLIFNFFFGDSKDFHLRLQNFIVEHRDSNENLRVSY